MGRRAITRDVNNLQEGSRHREGDLGLLVFSPWDVIVDQATENIDLGGPGDAVVLERESSRQVRSHGEDAKVETTGGERHVYARDEDVRLGNVPPIVVLVDDQGLGTFRTPGCRRRLGGLALRRRSKASCSLLSHACDSSRRNMRDCLRNGSHTLGKVGSSGGNRGLPR